MSELNPFSRANPDRKQLIPIWAAVDGLGLQLLMLSPWVVGIYVSDYHFSLSAAGWLLSLEFSALAATSFLVTPRMDRAPRATMAITGAVLAGGGNLVCVFATSFSSLAAIRILTGVGYALAMAAGNAAAAGVHDPGRLYGHKLTLFAAFACATYLVMPAFIEAAGGNTLFAFMGAVDLLLIVLIRGLPQHAEVEATQQRLGEQSAARIGMSIMRWVFVLIFVAALLFWLREAMVYVYSERIAVDLGIRRETLGLIFATSALVGLLGPILSVWVGHRFGPERPAILFVLLSVCVTYTVLQTKSPWIYAAMVIVWTVTQLGSFALLMGLAGWIDREGRLITACGGAMQASFALSPALAGYLLETGGKALTAGVTVAIGVMSIAALILVASFWSTAAVRARAAAAQQD